MTMKRARLGYLLSLVVMLLSSATVSAETATELAGAQEWPAYGRTYTQDHYSPLRDINDSNVAKLGLAWSFDIPRHAASASVPLEVEGRLYFVSGYSVVRALDASTGKLLWAYDPQATSAEGASLRYPYYLRGIAFANHKIYVGTQDARLIAIDALTGHRVWSVATTEGDDSRFITSAPLTFEHTVVVGNSLSEFGNRRGYITAYDSETGRMRWRFFTIPGDPRKGFENKAMESAAQTWTGQWWENGGGGFVWNAMTYDPQTRRIYFGTSNGTPWNRKFRSPGGGDNLFLCSIIALDADTGAYVWHYQTNPGDTWDFDATEDIELAELTVAGKPRRVLMQASKNGFFYVLDRDTGKLISAQKFSAVTWAERIDMATGRPVELPNARYTSGKTEIQPGVLGAHGPQPMAFNPATHLVYIPVFDGGFTYDDKGVDASDWKASPFIPRLGINVSSSGGSLAAANSWLLAWDPVASRAAWRVPVPGFGGAGIATTAGNLVFQGRCDGRFVAYSASDGRPLWSFDTREGIVGAPMTYEVGGRQYVSVMASIAGFTGCGPAGSPWDKPVQARRLLTFALESRQRLAAAPPPVSITPVQDPGFKPDAKAESAGEAWFYTLCAGCHGANAIAGGGAPDLRASAAIVTDKAFRDIVTQGALLQQGMPRFEALPSRDAESVRQYIRSRARMSSEEKGLTLH